MGKLLEGLIKINFEGRDRQPVATCDLDETIESREKYLGDTITGWVRRYLEKNGLGDVGYELSREGSNFKFVILT